MVTASIDRLKFWITARCVSLPKPRSVHQRVGTLPAKPPMPPITPPTSPTAPSPQRLPPMRGRRCAISMTGHHSASSAPSTALNQSMSRCGRIRTPSGIPARPPSRKGHSKGQLKPRRTENTASSWPVSAPNTASAAASRGSSTQAQNDMATMPKAKPDRPCTNPATAAPTATIHTASIALRLLVVVSGGGRIVPSGSRDGRF